MTTPSIDQPPEGERLNLDALARYMKALANDNRLDVLRQLQNPKPAREIRLRPSRSEPGGELDRFISSTAVKQHLAELTSLGLVTTLPERGDRGAVLYMLNHQKMFAVVEEMRGLVTLRAPPLPGQETLAAALPDGSTPEPAGPRIVVVHGREEGRAFPLTRRTRSERGWIIGRRADLDVGLDWDPFVSAEHAELLPRLGGYALLDLRTNANGTMLNWRRLGKGEELPLQTGDVIGVGKSLLLFRAD